MKVEIQRNTKHGLSVLPASDSLVRYLLYLLHSILYICILR